VNQVKTIEASKGNLQDRCHRFGIRNLDTYHNSKLEGEEDMTITYITCVYMTTTYIYTLHYKFKTVYSGEQETYYEKFDNLLV
jgi:hypothetical protein